MLEELERIDWSRLEHAYGSAEDVPGLIRDLRSRRRRTRERALWELFGNIHHQGTVYSATAPAVPFLAELLRSEEVDYRIRVELAWLLEAIAGGSSYLDVHRPLLEEDGERVDDAELEQELRWVRAAREAVGLELPTLAPLVDGGQPELSLSIAALAGRYPEHAAQTVPLVRGAYESEVDAARRRILALVLLLLGEQSRTFFDELRAAPADDAEPELLDEVLPALEHGEILEQAYNLLEDLLGASLRGWNEG